MTIRKQCTQIANDSKSDLQNTTCGVPQRSILGPLFFIFYVNDLPSSFKILNPIVFSDDKNLFYEHKNIIKHFGTVNAICFCKKIPEIIFLITVKAI